MNGSILQGFSWYLPADGSHWKRLAEQAPDFAYEGITAVWMPPAYKAEKGAEDVGYGVYDTYWPRTVLRGRVLWPHGRGTAGVFGRGTHDVAVRRAVALQPLPCELLQRQRGPLPHL